MGISILKRSVDGAAARRTSMAKRATLDGLLSLAAALSAGEPLVPARAQRPQLGVLPPAASLTNATSVLRRLAQAENVGAALIAPSEPESVVEQTDAAADPSVAAIGIILDGTHPPILSPAALIGIGHRAAAAVPAHVGSDNAKTGFHAQEGLTVLSRGRS
jgi:PPE-repeat protein